MTDRAAWIDEVARRVFTLTGHPHLRAVPELFVEPCPSSIYVSDEEIGGTQDAELHAVGVYEAQRSAEQVHVAIRPTRRLIVLLLMSCEHVAWHIDVEEGATLAGIFLSCAHPSTVTCNAALKFVTPVEGGPCAHTFEPSLGREPLLARCRAVTRQELTSFQGEYSADRFRVPPYDDIAPIRQVLTRHRELLKQRTTPFTAPFFWVANGLITRQGTREQPIPAPKRAKSVAFCDADGRFYVNTDHELYAIDSAGVCEQIVPSGRRFGWLGGVTYDSKRRRVVVTTFWHGGVHHLYDPVRNTWSTVDVDRTGGGIHAIVYDPVRDVMVAVGARPFRGGELIALHPDLDQVRPFDTTSAVPLPPWRPDMRYQMAGLPDAVLLCCAERDPMLGADVPPDHIFLVRLDRDEQLRVDPRVLPQYDPVASGFPPPPVLDEDDGFISLDALRHDPKTIVEKVHRREAPRLVTHPDGLSALMVGPRLYHGQVASLDETTHGDWQERLARATREIDEGRLVPHVAVVGRAAASAPRVLWTEQAVDDFAKLGEDASILRRLLCDGSRLTKGVPLDGPFHGWFALQVHEMRLVCRYEGGSIVVGYVRGDARDTWGRLVFDEPNS